MIYDSILQWIYATPIAAVMRTNDVLFPWIESIHVLALSLVLGSIAIVDLRLLGLASLDRTITGLSREILPITWIAFALAIITGLMMFSSNALIYAHNFYFLCKMLIIACAGMNVIIFQLVLSRHIEQWDALSPTPWTAKLSGALSLFFWVNVVWFGRQIGFSI